MLLSKSGRPVTLPTLKSRLDLAGAVVAIGCAIHCTVLPLLLAAVATTGLEWLLDTRVEWAVVIGSFVLGLGSFLPGYRQHRRPDCFALFAVGLMLIVGARMAAHQGRFEIPLILAGGAFLVSAHGLNLVFCQRCQACRH